ncbi:velvet factor-domain-containing protein [Phlyctochytrium arcticum]|nr:velvet factor-domain-containing protein [Phlyctochytrium arcticum]
MTVPPYSKSRVALRPPLHTQHAPHYHQPPPLSPHSASSNTRSGISSYSSFDQPLPPHHEPIAGMRPKSASLADIKILPSSGPPSRRYELRIRQQPARARMSGFGNSDRRPVDPPPILQLCGVDAADTDEACRLVVHASLWSADGSEDRNIVVSPYYYLTRQLGQPGYSDDQGMDEDDGEATDKKPDLGASSGGESAMINALQQQRRKGSVSTASGKEGRETDQKRDMIQTLVGSVVSPCVPLEDLEGREGLFFVFHDLSIRTPGQYRIRFSLLKLVANASMGQPSGTPILATAMSDVVSVYQPKRFPGLLGTTELSECFARQGVPIHVRRNRSKKQAS